VDDDVGELAGDARLTVYLDSDKPASRRPAYKEVVEHLRSCDVAGATVLLGVDGIAHGKRRRSRFFSGNADAPLAVDSIGTAESIMCAWVWPLFTNIQN
jgi:PII-like signaling protein